jgi:hypothetical protein
MAIWPLANRFAAPAPGPRGQVMAPPLNLSNYTPEFAAEVRQMRANAARLAAMSAPLTQPRTRSGAAARPDARGYTPELASAWRQAARSAGQHATPGSRPDSRSVVRIAGRGDR